MQVLLGYADETRWLRYARAWLRSLFPYLPGQPATTSGSASRPTRAGDDPDPRRRHDGVADDAWLIDSTPVECGRFTPDREAFGPRRVGRLRLLRVSIRAGSGDFGCISCAPRPGCRSRSCQATPKVDERGVRDCSSPTPVSAGRTVRSPPTRATRRSSSNAASPRSVAPSTSVAHRYQLAVPTSINRHERSALTDAADATLEQITARLRSTSPTSTIARDARTGTISTAITPAEADGFYAAAGVEPPATSSGVIPPARRKFGFSGVVISVR